jgi:ABC-type dipeptide/oligopeptide/nickel transport system permease component
MSLARYLAFRLGLAVPVLLGILALTFLLTHVLPTNPAIQAAGPLATEQSILQKEQELGLDRPLARQFVDYFWDLARGDLGRSAFSGRPVARDLLDRLPSTLELITLGIIFAFVIGVGVAVLAADRDRGVRNLAARAYGTFGTAVPDFFLALVLILVFYTALEISPAPLGQAGPHSPEVPHWSGAYLIDAIADGNAGAVGAALAHLVLPVATLSLVYSAPIYRVARAAIEEGRRAPYVDYAVMMGGSRCFVWRAVIENSLPPVLTITGVIYGLLLGGAVVVETVFSWGGIGQYAVTAITQNDYFATQGFVLFAATFSVIVYLVVDLLHAALDPRVRRAL